MTQRVCVCVCECSALSTQSQYHFRYLAFFSTQNCPLHASDSDAATASSDWTLVTSPGFHTDDAIGIPQPQWTKRLNICGDFTPCQFDLGSKQGKAGVWLSSVIQTDLDLTVTEFKTAACFFFNPVFFIWPDLTYPTYPNPNQFFASSSCSC